MNNVNGHNNNNYNLNFSFHLGHKVCGFTDVAFIRRAAIGPIESLCREPSLRLKLNRKLLCLRNLLLSGESKLSIPVSGSVRGVNGGWGESGGCPPPIGVIPSIQ